MNQDKNTSSIKGRYKLAAGVAAVATPAAAQAASIGALSLSLSPWMLLSVPAVVGLWWLMKSIPKQPVRQIFPGITLLYNLKSEEQTPTRMPWWQYIPITLAAAAVVGALAKPEWNPEAPLEGSGPVTQLIDNGWPSARNWNARTDSANHLIDRAERAQRSVIIVPTAAPDDGSPLRAIGPISAGEARQVIKDMKPHPWPVDRAAALQALTALGTTEKGSVFWLSDGLHDENAAPLAEKLKEFGKLTVIEDDKSIAPRLIDQPAGSSENLTVTVRRTQTGSEETVPLTAVDEAGQPLYQVTATFKVGEDKADAVFKLPSEIGNQVTSITIEGDNTAGARVLLDERFRRRPVGLIQSGKTDGAPSLLNESDYLQHAMGPYVDLHQGSIDDLLNRKLAVIVMADSVSVGNAQNKQLEEWVRAGGTLLRFAGPRLAEQPITTEDPLLPLKLRQGSRTLGGNVSGGKEGKLAPFADTSPFAGIALPDNVNIKQQVLPQPGMDNDGNTWARLQDGTPLVTAGKHGAGQIVLVHTTADPRWADIAYSGLFVDMLRAVVTSSQGVANQLEGGEISLPPVKIMDGEGRMTTPSPAVRPLTAQAIADHNVSPQHPPGFYGNESVKQAHNLSGAVAELKPLAALADGIVRKTYEAGKKDTDMTGYMWAGALAFLLLDMGIMLWQRRGSRSTPKKTRTTTPTPDN